MNESQAHSPFAEAFDRGPAKYFHGREDILAKFWDTLWHSEQKSWHDLSDSRIPARSAAV